MRMQESITLGYLAKVAKKTTKQLSVEIFEDLQNNNLLKEGVECWGMKVKEACKEVAVIKYMQSMERVGIKSSTANLNVFLDLLFVLDGECHNCGYDMEVIHEEKKHVFGNGYDDPEEYITLWEEKQCLHCGIKITNEPT